MPHLDSFVNNLWGILFLVSFKKSDPIDPPPALDPASVLPMVPVELDTKGASLPSLSLSRLEDDTALHPDVGLCFTDACLFILRMVMTASVFMAAQETVLTVATSDQIKLPKKVYRPLFPSKFREPFQEPDWVAFLEVKPASSTHASPVWKKQSELPPVMTFCCLMSSAMHPSLISTYC
jgi:hypothetical protein